MSVSRSRLACIWTRNATASSSATRRWGPKRLTIAIRRADGSGLGAIGLDAGLLLDPGPGARPDLLLQSGETAVGVRGQGAELLGIDRGEGLGVRRHGRRSGGLSRRSGDENGQGHEEHPESLHSVSKSAAMIARTRIEGGPDRPGNEFHRRVTKIWSYLNSSQEDR